MKSMEKILLQRWEESDKLKGTTSDGCTLHLNLIDRDLYVKKHYKDRDINNIPDTYDRIVGQPIEVLLDEEIYNILLENTIRLTEYEMNNMINLGVIINNEDKGNGYNISDRYEIIR
jgi:hypothetical protein